MTILAEIKIKIKRKMNQLLVQLRNIKMKKDKKLKGRKNIERS